MKHALSYPNVIRRWYRPVEHECWECNRTLREQVALSKRTVITLDGVIKLNHAGYRCLNELCPGCIVYYPHDRDSLLNAQTVGDISVRFSTGQTSQERSTSKVNSQGHEDSKQYTAALAPWNPASFDVRKAEMIYFLQSFLALNVPIY